MKAEKTQKEGVSRTIQTKPGKEGKIYIIDNRARKPFNSYMSTPIQRQVYNNMAAMWQVIEPSRTEAQIRQITNAEPALAQVYTDITNHIQRFDFIHQNGHQPEAVLQPNPAGQYPINYGLRTELDATYNNVDRYIGAILHEMMHITAALQYQTHVPPGSVGHGANMHLPQPIGNVAPDDVEVGLTENQFSDQILGALPQLNTMSSNWDNLSLEAELDVTNQHLSTAQRNVIEARIQYARFPPGSLTHYDTVLTDILYYLKSEGVQNSRAYMYAHDMLTEANARRIDVVNRPAHVVPRAPLPIPAPPPQTFLQWLLSFFH